jgi:DNA-binding NarL/FixJ family response regulator
MEVVGEAGDGREAVRPATELVPDMVVMGLGRPLLNGRDSAREILRAVPRMAVIIRQLGISPKTAETYGARIMEKLAIYDTAGFVRYAIRQGPVQP